MVDHSESIKALIKKFRGWASTAQRRNEQVDATRFNSDADKLEAVLEELERLQRITQPIPASYGDLSDLPPDLLKELTGIKSDDLEQQLFTIIKHGGDEVDLDAILIELWRRFKIAQTRKFLQNKLWRMAQKGVVWSVPGKKGVYAASAPPAAQKPDPDSFDAVLDDDVPF